MNFVLWFTILFAMLVSMVVADASCPAGLEAYKGSCASKRPVHGTCPDLTRYNVAENMCIYDARS